MNEDKEQKKVNIKLLTNCLLRAVQNNDLSYATQLVEAGAIMDGDNVTVNPMILAAQLGRKKLLNYFNFFIITIYIIFHFC